MHSKSGAHFLTAGGVLTPELKEWTVTDAYRKERLLDGLWQVAENNKHNMDPYCYQVVTAICTAGKKWGQEHQKKEFWKYIGLYVHPRKGRTIENTHLVISDLFCGLQCNQLYVLKESGDCFQAMQMLSDYNDFAATMDRWHPAKLREFRPVLTPDPPEEYNCWFNVFRTMPSNDDRGEPAPEPAPVPPTAPASSSKDYQPWPLAPVRPARQAAAPPPQPAAAATPSQQCPWPLAPVRQPAAASAVPPLAICDRPRGPSSSNQKYVEPESESSARSRASRTRRWGHDGALRLRRDSSKDEEPPPPPPGPPRVPAAVPPPPPPGPPPTTATAPAHKAKPLAKRRPHSN